MGVAIQIKRSQVTNTPVSLNPGELAWSDASATLFVGLASGSGITAVGGSGVFATLASPALTGTPTAPTAAASTNTTQVATTAFVHAWVPITTVGDLLYGNGTNSTARLAGNASTAKQFLSQNGNGTLPNAPAWTAIAPGDIPVFGASGAGHSPGGVPDPGSTSGTARFLREDSSWATPVGSVASVTAGDSTVTIGGTALNPTVAVAAGGITNTQVSSSAAIAYSKLNLSGSIVNGDIASLSGSKINAGTVAAAYLPSLDGITAAAASVNLNSQKITNLANGTNPGDAVNYGQLSAAIQGQQPKPTAICATTAALPSYTYSNGSSGVGATITFSATGALTIDGHTLALNDVVAVLNETGGNAPYNGLYTVTTAPATGIAGVLTRHVDMDQGTEFAGAWFAVEGGTTSGNLGSLWLCTNTGTVTVGTTSITFTELNKATDLQQGTGISISGNTVSISASYAGQNSITTLGTVTTGTVDGGVF